MYVCTQPESIFNIEDSIFDIYKHYSNSYTIIEV